MKVKNKIFIFALILSLIFTVSCVAAEDLSFDQSELGMVSDETEMELNQKTDLVEQEDKNLNSQEIGERTQLLGEGQSLQVTGNNFTDIQTVINSAKAGDTIFLEGKTYKGSAQINVNKDDLTIIGGSSNDDDNYATLDVQGLSRIMHVTGKNVALKNIRFINGNTTGNGAAIYWNAVNGTLKDSIFENNYARLDGGAIYGHENSINATISNCTFTGNKAYNYNAVDGGSISGGAVNWWADNLIVNNSRFSHNSATNVAAAIRLGGNNVTVINSNFTNNTARNGGAIAFNENRVLGKLEHCKFENNLATSQGGAIYVRMDNVTLSNNIFINNTANVNSGAIRVLADGLNFKITGSVFINNTAKDWGAIGISSPNSTVSDCEFYNNTASANVGALYYSNDASNAVARNLIFINNKAGGNGGAIYSSANNVTVVNCNFTNNTVGGSGGAVMMARGSSTTYLKTVYYGDYSTVINCNFINNTAGNGNSALGWAAANATIENCYFANNYANSFGALGIGAAAANATVNNCTFENNTVVESYGALYTHGANGTLSNIKFINNKAKNVGALLINTGAMNSVIVNCSFVNNSATLSYGAATISAFNVTMSDCTFENNHAYGAESAGGAIRWNGANGTLTNAQFTNNSAVAYGGAVNWVGSNGTMTDCDYNNNSANYGGAIEWYGINADARNCNFTNNHANNEGGAIRLYDVAVNSTLTDCNFVNNSASMGGAVQWSAANGTLTGSEFKNNNASNSGGAVRWNGANGNLNDTGFENNSATNWGGAITWNAVNGTVTNSSFTENDAINGGAIRWSGTNGTLTDATFENNTGTTGGAINWATDNGNLTDISVSGGEGTAIHINSNNNTITNINITDNNGRGLDIIGNNNNLNDVAVSGGNGTGVVVNGNDNALSNVEVNDNNGTGVDARGDNNKLDEVKVSGGNGIAVQVTGKNTTLNNVNVTNHEGEGVVVNGTVNNESHGTVMAPVLSVSSNVNGFNVIVNIQTNGQGYVYFTINGKQYGQDVVNGAATFILGNMAPGTYSTSVYFTGSGMWANTTSKLEFNVLKQTGTIIAPNAVYSIVYGGTYSVTTNMPNQKIALTINGKTYTVSTDANGVARIQLTKAILGSSGAKTITVNGANDYYTTSPVSAKLTVNKEKTKFVVKKTLKFKKSKKTKKIKVTLKDSKNKAVNSVKVTLKVKGKVKGKKSYILKTKKGVVTFNLKKTQFSKKGKYTATLTFKGNGNYNKVSKKIKITIK